MPTSCNHGWQPPGLYEWPLPLLAAARRLHLRRHDFLVFPQGDNLLAQTQGFVDHNHISWLGRWVEQREFCNNLLLSMLHVALYQLVAHSEVVTVSFFFPLYFFFQNLSFQDFMCFYKNDIQFRLLKLDKQIAVLAYFQIQNLVKIELEECQHQSRHMCLKPKFAVVFPILLNIFDNKPFSAQNVEECYYAVVTWAILLVSYPIGTGTR